jgi:hypothetical protein
MSTDSSASAPLLVWFQLLDSDVGQPYKGTSVSSILRSSLAVPMVDQFRKAVKAEFDQPNYLKDLPSSMLKVYKNKASFDKRTAGIGKEEPLNSDMQQNGKISFHLIHVSPMAIKARCQYYNGGQ